MDGSQRRRCAADVYARLRADDIPRLGARVIERASDPAATSRSSAPPTIACSRCATAARTRAGRCRRASCYGDRVACPLHNWTIELDDGRGGRAGRGLRARASRCAIERRASCYVALDALSADGARGRDALDLLLLRRRLRRRHRARRRDASPACAAIPIIRRTSASSAARAARCT